MQVLPVAARTSFLSGSVAGAAASVRFVGKAAGKGGFRLVTAMAKKSVGDLTEADLKGKVVFERADLNVPLDKELNITDDTRIRVRAACVAACCCQACGWLGGLRCLYAPRTSPRAVLPLRRAVRGQLYGARRGAQVPRLCAPRAAHSAAGGSGWVKLAAVGRLTRRAADPRRRPSRRCST